jgi:uncharacterized protein
MSSLRDQLLKMGLVDETQAKKAAHDKRRSNKKKGRDGVQAERAQRSAEQEQQAQAKRAADKTREQERAGTRETAERTHQAQQILESGRVRLKSGRRRFYYESRDGRVPYVEMDDRQAAQIEGGALALCETPDGRVSLVNAESAARLAEISPEWMRAGR